MAGAHGVLKNVKELCEALLLDSEVQIVVVCGKNAALKQSLSDLEQASRSIEGAWICGTN